MEKALIDDMNIDSTPKLLEYLRELPKDQIILINVGGMDYLKTNIEILKVLVNEDKLPGVYITVNKPYTTIKKILQDNGIDPGKMHFIDCITKISGGEMADSGEVLYLDSPENLTGIGVAMGEAMRSLPEGDKFLFMDSLSTLLLYRNMGTVAKFSHFLTGRMRTWGLKGILMAVEKEADPEFTQHLAQFCDAVVSVDRRGDTKNG